MTVIGSKLFFQVLQKTAKLMGKSRDEYKDVTKQMSVETDKF
jgi:hypothetical protein